MSRYYRLEGRTPVPFGTMEEYFAWCKSKNYDKLQRVGYTYVNLHTFVSTIFMNLDHSFNSGTPVLFETMVFGGPLDQEMERYHTYDEAEAGHARWCEEAFRAEMVKVEIVHKNLALRNMKGRKVDL